MYSQVSTYIDDFAMSVSHKNSKFVVFLSHAESSFYGSSQSSLTVANALSSARCWAEALQDYNFGKLCSLEKPFYAENYKGNVWSVTGAIVNVEKQTLTWDNTMSWRLIVAMTIIDYMA